jgi:acyl carrier protein
VHWAHRRFLGLRDSAHAWLAQRQAGLSARTLAQVIGRYRRSIGDLQQSMAGERQGMDALLQRAAPPSAELNMPADADSARARDFGGARRGKAESLAPNRPFDADAAASSRRLVVDSVLNWLRLEKRRVLETLDDSVTFAALGMDSLSAIALSGELEARTGLEVSAEVLYECQTLGQLVAYVEACRVIDVPQEGLDGQRGGTGAADPADDGRLVAAS